ncbi:hypothetical protein KAS24_01920 [Candidatus Bathyarchaeota archaeon]|nr:hypothetical protein [Candidatus Bathyarchaeota archaeon]
MKKGTYEGAINQTLAINKMISLIGEDPENTITIFALSLLITLFVY